MLCRLRTLVDDSGRDVTSLDDVRSISDEARRLLDDYLAERGQILASGYDITSFTLAELPGGRARQHPLGDTDRRRPIIEAIAGAYAETGCPSDHRPRSTRCSPMPVP